MNKKSVVGVAFLEMSKLFDMVDYEILCNKLGMHGLDQTLEGGSGFIYQEEVKEQKLME